MIVNTYTFQYAIAAIVLFFQAAGIAAAVRALFSTRSSQGAIAWIMGLVIFPYVTVPLYWIFGRDRFLGYVTARRGGSPELEAARTCFECVRADLSSHGPESAPTLRVLERLAGMPFTRGNNVTLLKDGLGTFPAIFEAIAQAEKYVLVQFYIIHDDGMGRELKDSLTAKARQGLSVKLLYDAIGSHALPEAFVRDLEQAGVEVRAFNTTKRWRNRLQLNFRNHRKIVVADGHTAFVGGLNVGDEYMGRNRRFGSWRDTHLRCEGPAATAVQLAFVEDWYWAKGKVPALNWEAAPSPDGHTDVLALPSGPADQLETYSLAFIQCAKAATKRLWIVSPYFVPDKEITCALQLAALRGVDVRVMLPLKPDHRLVHLASFSYFPELERLGVKFYRYKPGFLHQKVVLVDNSIASVGTANCDNRSFRLNFEITMIMADQTFASQVESMLLTDFAHCERATAKDYDERWFGFKAAVKLCRLLSPIL